ncbi:thiamine phosphate synthase [Methylobacterium sp. A54F]
MRPLPAPVLAVSDRHGCAAGLIDTARALLDGGCRWLWFRDTDLDPAERRRIAEDLVVLVHAAGGALTIGRDAALAAAIGADGVHLRAGAGPEAIAAARRILPEAALVGVSAHGEDEVSRARSGGADYATLSPIFASLSKPGYGPALGPAAIATASAHGLPILALGGLTPATAAACRHAGAAGIAVMGGLMRAPSPGLAMRELLAAWQT